MKKYQSEKRIIDVDLDYSIKSYGPDFLYKSNATDMRIYKGAILLTPGTWADSVTNANVLYKSSILSKYATRWESNHLNLGHDNANPLNLVGNVQNQRWENGVVKGDLYINKKTTNGRDVISLIESGLVNKLSIELNSTDYWDSKRKVRCADDIKFLGVAIVGDHQACKNAKIR